MALWTGPLNKATYIFIDFIATSKFFTLFSFLFGLGFVLFFQWALQRSQRPNLLFLRRIAILLMFGILHAFGIWYGDILLIYAIIAPLLLLFYHRQARTILRWAFGRLALSNYLLQSLMCTTLFYSYGLGLFGQVDPFYWLIIAALLFTLQIILSHFWVKRFRFGPAEWLWRSLTYGKRQPILKSDS